VQNFIKLSAAVNREEEENGRKLSDSAENITDVASAGSNRRRVRTVWVPSRHLLLAADNWGYVHSRSTHARDTRVHCLGVICF